MNIKELLKNNMKLYIIMGVIILLGTLGITFALTTSTFNPIAVNLSTNTIDAEVTYDEGTNSSVITTTGGEVLPIPDSIIETGGENVTDTRVIKAHFNVSGLSTNPENTIYDIALYANNENGLPCELRSKDVKWRLYKNGSMISSGNLSPTFDVMDNNRLVLTNTQQDLTLTPDKYTFLLWISESCTGDITTCNPSQAQNQYLNKEIDISLKIELATKSKKTLKRVTAEELSCYSTSIDIPACNSLTYNTSNQALVSTSEYYTVENGIANTPGSYKTILTLNEGYKWSDETITDKTLTCEIKRKDLTITTLSQVVSYGTNISTNPNNVTTSGLLSGHTLSKVLLTTNKSTIGTNTIIASNAVIKDASNNDVTNYYNISYENTGTASVNCLNSSTLPTATSYTYTGSTITGITGGTNVDITGVTSAVEPGTYTVTVIPKNNYCWTDSTTTSKTLTWTIEEDVVIISLDNGVTTTNGTPTIYNRAGTYYTNNTYTQEMTTTSNPIATPIKIGYTFDGYYTEENGNGTQMIDSKGYATEDLLNYTPIQTYSRSISNLTLYANYTQKTYTIKYDANGGTGAPSSQTKIHGEPLTITLTEPTKTNDNFKGWSTNKKAPVPTYLPGDTITTNVNLTLYAIWEVKLVDFISNTYLDNKNKIVADYNVEYQYAESVNLMNDRLGGATDDYDAGNIRYYGKNPNNYVDIGDRTSDGEVILYRIIGLFKDIELAGGTNDNLVKVIRNESIGEYSWDTSMTATTGIGGGYGTNNWTQADLMKLLNPGYTGITGGSLWWDSKSGSCYAGEANATKPCDFTSTGLSEGAQLKIEEVVWNLGAVDDFGYRSNEYYEYERSETGGSTTTWTGKVAIMYPSDYGYATNFNTCDYGLSHYGESGCHDNDWLNITNMDQWQITRWSAFNTAVCTVSSQGYVENYGSGFLDNEYTVRPTFFLNSELIIEAGDGSKDNPYVLR